MNILILYCGSRSGMLSRFRAVAAPGELLIAAESDPWATAIYDADRWYLLPPVSDTGFVDRVLEICRVNSVDRAVVPAPREAALLAGSRDRFAREGVALVTSEEELQNTFSGCSEVMDICRGCFTEPKPTLRDHGNRARKAVTRLLPQSFKTRVSRIPDYLTTYQENKRIIRTESRRIAYLLGGPAHSNLGDHAIAFAQTAFIRNALPDVRVVEISDELVDMHLGYIRRHIKPGDLLCMIGGGNFGDEYLWYERSRRRVCTMFPEHRVIVFPQTISYSDTPRGQRELALTREALGSHGRLTITARDKVSHRRAQAWFSNADCILTPDIVLSLNPIRADAPRQGILCCLRRDVERNAALSAGDVVTRLAEGGYRFTLTDTVTARAVSLWERADALDAKWREFCGAGLVITDRLHGMIFSCITSTPCIVIDNYNHKVRNFYQTWLREVSSIRFAERADDILPLAKELLNRETTPWDPGMLAAGYAPLLNALRKET